MTRRSDSSLVAVLLTARAIESPVAPLKAAEFWTLLANIDDPAELLGSTAAELTERFGDELGPRIAALLDRATALAFKLEELENAGIATLAPLDDGYPTRWRELLGKAAPPLLHAAGPTRLLNQGGLAIVGSRDLGTAGAEIAKQAAANGAQVGRVVISGGARGTDRLAMQAALHAGGNVVGVLADSLVRTASDPEVRRAVAEERLCLGTPYAPTAPFSPGNAMGRNKLIYALADMTFVVASDAGKGGTWEGATEALKKKYGRVLVWTGEGEGSGNAALVALGATRIRTVDEILNSPRDTPDADKQLRLGI